MKSYFIASTAFFAVLASPGAWAQPCELKLRGTVTDAGQHPIPGAIVRLVTDSTKGAATDAEGVFVIDHVCSGHTVLVCTATGYKQRDAHIDMAQNSDVRFTLTTSSQDLQEVVVNGVRLQDLHSTTQLELHGAALMKARGDVLGNALKELPGLNALQTGPSLSKPVIHGLHSNRVLILNNGVRQEGQQWGSEHAPEIDPFTANHITVVKGAASVRYGSDAIGGVVLLDPDPLPTGKGINGDLYLVGASNGRMGNASALVQGGIGKVKGLGWRAQGTLKRAGNFSTPGYYMKNTGLKEGDFSVATGYKHERVEVNAYYSQYRAVNGIFEGAHAGNVTDLNAAFLRPRPITASYFSYDIARSYQDVYHDVLKGAALYRFTNEGKLELSVARQKDLRQEFDIDVPFSKDPSLLQKPQVSFQLVTHTADLVYTQPSRNSFSGNAGISFTTQGNVFKGLYYLVPNFRTYGGGAFAIERYHRGKFTFEAGARYDYKWQRVYRLAAQTLQQYSSTLTFRNATGTVGAIYRPGSRLSFTINTGRAWRAPSINELYINGVHFSDATYQVGDSTLKSEQALNTSLSATYRGAHIRITVDGYYNYIANYIYQRPTLKPVTTIRGTFPAFYFRQDNVAIRGIDASVQVDVLKNLALQNKTTIVRGFNLAANEWLIYMPADRFENGISYGRHKWGKLDEPYCSVEYVTVLTQTRVPPNSDFVAPPNGYGLLNANVGASLPLGKKKLTVDLGVQNLTDVAYCDYLNHFRYYTDDLGVNFTIRTKLSF